MEELETKVKHNKKKKPIIVRLLFLILFIILLPIYIIYTISKFIYNTVKYRKWKKELFAGDEYVLGQTISSIDLMEGYEFEYFLKNLFFYQGYDVTLTPKRGDYGADLILTTRESKIVVQAKRYSKKVGSKSVQEVISAKNHYRATDAMVITNSIFTNQADEIARENGVRLVDRYELIEMLNEVKDRLSQNSAINMQYKPNDEYDRYQI